MSRPKKHKLPPKLNLASEESKRVIAAFQASQAHLRQPTPNLQQIPRGRP